MKKTTRRAGLSPNQERIQSILEYKKYRLIKREELISLISNHNISKNPRYLIKSMLQKGRLISFKRGSYIVVPMSSINKSPGQSDLEINEYILGAENYYIGLYNAFNFHGFTEQIPNKLFVFNTKYSADKMILHHKFKFFKVKGDKLFGIIKNKYPYSDKERTIIDALDYPEYLGGLNEVMDKIKNAEFNKEKLIEYAIRYNSNKIIKLVGILTNSKGLFNLLNKKKALGYYTTIKKTGTKLLDRKWKIRLI